MQVHCPAARILRDMQVCKFDLKTSKPAMTDYTDADKTLAYIFNNLCKNYGDKPFLWGTSTKFTSSEYTQKCDSNESRPQSPEPFAIHPHFTREPIQTTNMQWRYNTFDRPWGPTALQFTNTTATEAYIQAAIDAAMDEHIDTAQQQYYTCVQPWEPTTKLECIKAKTTEAYTQTLNETATDKHIDVAPWQYSPFSQTSDSATTLEYTKATATKTYIQDTNKATMNEHMHTVPVDHKKPMYVIKTHTNETETYEAVILNINHNSTCAQNNPHCYTRESYTTNQNTWRNNDSDRQKQWEAATNKVTWADSVRQGDTGPQGPLTAPPGHSLPHQGNTEYNRQKKNRKENAARRKGQLTRTEQRALKFGRQYQ